MSDDNIASLVVAAAARARNKGQPSDAPKLSEDALALEFARRHAGDLRYVNAWSRWLHFDGKAWNHENTLFAYDRARAVCREMTGTFLNSKTVNGVVQLARTDRRLAATTDQWDSDPWLLNTPDGVVDLRTGRLRPASVSDYITEITAVAPGGECPTWLAFLDRITGGDADLAQFIQRVLGYGLTGSIQEHALFFCYGTGANGKSVLLSTVAKILGDYHRTAPIETFIITNSEQHPTDLAGLRGARLVTATETEEGRRWAESKIKMLTGGDRVAARFMRQDFFEFTPQFKLVIAGNHRPGLRSVDEATRRRFNLIPFAVTIPPEERDPELADKLKAEWPGILAWMIQGCVMWQRMRLSPPKAVTDATASYLEAEDAISSWIEERCTRDANAWHKQSELFGSYKVWSERTGEFVGTQKRFNQQLETRGFQPKRFTDGRGFYGLKLNSCDQ